MIYDKSNNNGNKSQFQELKYDREEEEEGETPAAWRFHEGVDDFGPFKLWKKNFNREATITVHPVATGITIGFVDLEFVRFLHSMHFI